MIQNMMFFYILSPISFQALRDLHKPLQASRRGLQYQFGGAMDLGGGVLDPAVLHHGCCNACNYIFVRCRPKNSSYYSICFTSASFISSHFPHLAPSALLGVAVSSGTTKCRHPPNGGGSGRGLAWPRAETMGVFRHRLGRDWFLGP